jgi:serine/threonine-protein kinase
MPVTDDFTLELGSTLAGKYKILRVLGAGGMGAVYLAENTAIARQVAIKVLHARMGRDAATLKRFRQEARATATIGHPGVVDVLDMGETAAGEAFIVMEKLEGQTMGARLKQRHRLSVDETIAIVSEALAAIGAAHDKGIVHRDLKPDNLFLVWHPKWCVKILDFGISRVIDAEEIRLTASNTVMGSVLYMPPEQARDARVAGPPADLYALGAVMYHALTGRPPFGGESYSEVLSRVLTDAPEPITALRPELPTALAELVMALLAKAPTERPGPAREIRERLLAMVEHVEPPAEPAPPPDALGATFSPADAMAATADVSATPLGATAESSPPHVAALGATAAESAVARPVDLRGLAVHAHRAHPVGATTGMTAGEVSLPPTPVKRRGLLGLALAAVAAGGIGLFVAMRDDKLTATTFDAASSPDAGVADPQSPDAGVIDASPPIDALTDAGPRLDAPKRPPRAKDVGAEATPQSGSGSGSSRGSGTFIDIQPDPR